MGLHLLDILTNGYILFSELVQVLLYQGKGQLDQADKIPQDIFRLVDGPGHMLANHLADSLLCRWFFSLI